MDQPESLQNTSIHELLTRYPAVVATFLAHRMACVGCDVNAFHTLGEALDLYHLDRNAFVQELNETIQRAAEPPALGESK